MSVPAIRRHFPLNRSTLIVLLGLLLRLAYVFFTSREEPHPDLISFLIPAQTMTHPFNTSPREPFFVWWLWGLSKISLTSTAAIRTATSFWFVASLLLFTRLARRCLGTRGASCATALYAFLPGQIRADTVGLRHVVEGVGVLWLLETLASTEPPPAWKSFVKISLANALLVLTRINFLGSCLLVSIVAACRLKKFRPLLGMLPAIFLILFHFQDNKATHGDPFYSINLHTYWFSNLEYIGRPGFPSTWEEWQKQPHKPSLTFRQWAFERHTFGEYAKESVIGYFRCLWIFSERIYFSLGMPWIFKWVLLSLYVAGLTLSWTHPLILFVTLAYSCFLLPYAFVSHVFWAGRFFVPFSPIVLILLVFAAQKGERLILSRLPKGLFTPGSARFFPLLSDPDPAFVNPDKNG